MTVIDEIAAERRRQIEAEGWTPEHDDHHDESEMARAAACYALSAAGFFDAPRHPQDEQVPAVVLYWPWGDDWWKPKDDRRDLIHAAALLVAEIERRDRRAANPTTTVSAGQESKP